MSDKKSSAKVPVLSGDFRIDAESIRKALAAIGVSVTGKTVEIKHAQGGKATVKFPA
jgi:hypothetical protein